MNFIEQWLGFSPDAGSGVFEACMILAVLAVTCVFAFRGKIEAAFHERVGNVTRAR